MTTRTLPRTDVDSIVELAVAAIAELIDGTASANASESELFDAQTMAAVVDGTTLVFGLSIGTSELADLTRLLLPDLESEPDETELGSARVTITSRFFAAVEEAIGQPLIEVDQEPFDKTWRVDLAGSMIEVGFVSIPVGAPAGAPPSPSRLSSVRLDVSVELGRAKIPVKDLLALDEGGVIRLGRPVGDPVDLVVNGTVTARGEIVVVDGRLGLRIIELV